MCENAQRWFSVLLLCNISVFIALQLSVSRRLYFVNISGLIWPGAGPEYVPVCDEQYHSSVGQLTHSLR